MTTFKTIAEQMRKQGMSETQIRRWGRMGQEPVVTSTGQTPTAPKREPSELPTTSTPPQAKRGGAPSRQAIARYWMNQMTEHWDNPTTMTKDERTRFYSKPSFKRKMMLQDWGEPCCWACGWYKNDQADYGVSHFTNPLESWDRAVGLEKCHIVPHMLGGSNDPSNLVLLCKKCHKDAPDTKNPRHMFRFIGKRPHFQEKFMREVSQLPSDDMQIVLENQAEFKAYLGENMGVHYGGDSTETLVGLVEDFAEDFRDGLIDPIATEFEEKE